MIFIVLTMPENVKVRIAMMLIAAIVDAPEGGCVVCVRGADSFLVTESAQEVLDKIKQTINNIQNPSIVAAGARVQ